MAKRYNVKSEIDLSAWIEEAPGGVLVMASDYDALAAELAKCEGDRAQDQQRLFHIEGALDEKRDRGIDFLQKWMRAPNPMLGDAVPIELMRAGLGHRVAAFIESAFEAETVAEPDRSEPDFEDWEGPWCKTCGAPVVEIPGFAPGCLRNCPMPAETSVMHDKCEHGKGLGDKCEPCGDDDDSRLI